MAASCWLFGNLETAETGVRFRGETRQSTLESKWLEKNQPSAYMHAELKLHEQLVATKRTQVTGADTAGAHAHQYPSAATPFQQFHRGPATNPSHASPPTRSEGSGMATFDEEDEDDDDGDDYDFPEPPAFDRTPVTTGRTFRS